jgi:hypothetical protein
MAQSSSQAHTLIYWQQRGTFFSDPLYTFISTSICVLLALRKGTTRWNHSYSSDIVCELYLKATILTSVIYKYWYYTSKNKP